MQGLFCEPRSAIGVVADIYLPASQMKSYFARALFEKYV